MLAPRLADALARLNPSPEEVPQDQRGLAFGGLARTTQAALHRPRSTTIALVLAGPRGPLLRGAGRHGASSTASTIARSGSPAPRAAWRRRRSRHRCPAEAMENASRKLTRSPEDAKLVPRAVIACWWIGGIKLAPACYQSATILSRSKPIQRDLDRQEAAPKCLFRRPQVFLGLGAEVLIIPWS